VPGHAGGFETSLLLAAAPELVRGEDRVGPEPRAAGEDPAVRVVYSEHGAWASGAGTSDDARGASREAGVRLLSIVEAEVARALVAFHRRAHG
jgi:creatinine amidohydrolase